VQLLQPADLAGGERLVGETVERWGAPYRERPLHRAGGGFGPHALARPRKEA
jgi:hypothetical protein